MIVIKDGINFAKVYADKAFDKWGTPTTEQLHVVEQWTDIDIPDTAERIDATKVDMPLPIRASILPTKGSEAMVPTAQLSSTRPSLPSLR